MSLIAHSCEIWTSLWLVSPLPGSEKRGFVTCLYGLEGSSWKADADFMTNIIIGGDEGWVYGYDPGFENSRVFSGKRMAFVALKRHVSRSNFKVVLVVFLWVRSKFVQMGTTVNSEY